MSQMTRVMTSLKCRLFFLLDPTRKKRIVEYYDPEDVWKYIGGGKRLPGMFSDCFLIWASYLILALQCNGQHG